MIDPSSHPELRRDNMTGTIVLRDGKDVEFPWITIWASVTDGWARHSDEAVLTWPVLNQGHYSPRWAEEQRRAIKALQRHNGEISHRIGEARAQLARERERRRKLVEWLAKLEPDR